MCMNMGWLKIEKIFIDPRPISCFIAPKFKLKGITQTMFVQYNSNSAEKDEIELPQ